MTCSDERASEAPQEFKDGLAQAAEASLSGAWHPFEWQQWLKKMQAMLGDCDGSGVDEIDDDSSTGGPC